MDQPGRADGREYPVEWEADVVLRDGSTTHVRPIRPEDADALQRFQMAQSERSTYLRFFAALQRIPDRLLTQLVTVDHVRRVALVAVRPGADDDGASREDIVGVTRYDVTDDEPGRRTAEVAFNIADALQGQGLGSVLLEHIAAAARERGVHRFIAEVLPQNRAMLGVFREAGYDVEQHLDDGVVTVSVDLDPTDRSREVMADREHRTEARSMQGLLSARRVLLVGPTGAAGPASAAEDIDQLLVSRVREAYAADPGDTELLVLGDDVTWADLAPKNNDTESTVDLAVVAAPPDEVIDAVRRLRGTGAHGVVVLSAGWAETGPAGVARRRELLRTAHAEGMRVVGPASYGLLTNVPGASLRASLALTAPRPGRVGLFSQSAPTAVTAAETVKRRGLGLSTLVSAGHRADVSGNDVMQYWQDDPHTDVVCLYLETLGNPRKFSRIARRLALVKPVVVVVAGRHGSVVPPGHTVRATRAPRRMLDEVLRQSGVIRAENTHQLMDVAQVLAHQPLPTGGRVGILASSPSLAALVADAVAAAGLTVVGPPEPLSAGAPDDEIAAAVDALYGPDACDAVVVVSVPVVLPRTDAMARAVAEAAARTGRTTVVSALGLHGMPDELAATVPEGLPGAGEEIRIPAFSTPEDAVWALGEVVRYARWRTQDHGSPVRPALREGVSDGVARTQARTLVGSLLARHPDGTTLDQDAATELLACYGLRLWGSRSVRAPQEAVAAAEELGWPVALKIASPALRHRADLGGVRLDIADAEDLVEDAERMLASASALLPAPDPVLEVQAMAPTGVACVVRSVEDELFGPVVSFGVAGDAVDLLDDVTHGVPPLTDVDVARMVRGVRAAPRLFGYQGAPAADVAALEDVLARVSVMAEDLPELASVELYPVAVAERGASVLHATIRLRPAERRTDALRRALPG
ncbi:bifunctional GNAT family N-acetyltransferase/acetate--CoA ligase family protein [Promicromonospora sukumoe]|uniref:Acyl-CoA synthetase (NDP forming)/RimJ/RimL family protein N-acetyltransferase n=1 Tax=Promicromonospora sukumoe TaxID=88382 RepID=A0A7W3JA07_9MICO|nr:GNAT family N-acetyltransferase [Promicromonospora sukumoe]MBA8808884.1 acyl-CoA synthetase (NDP forming)/RimJ/RimL family protein N-acetyltransferase [Promicromonospora sukumoe]